MALPGFDPSDVPGFGDMPGFANDAPGFSNSGPGFAPPPQQQQQQQNRPMPLVPTMPGTQPQMHHQQHQQHGYGAPGQDYGGYPHDNHHAHHQHHHHAHHQHHQQHNQHGGYPPQQGGYGAPPMPQSDYDTAPRQPRQPRGGRDRDPTNTVWLGFIEPWATDDLLRREFSQYGKVLRTSRLADKGIVFVHYLTVEEAQRAVDIVNHTGSLGNTKVGYGKMFHYDQDELDRMARFDDMRDQRGSRPDFEAPQMPGADGGVPQMPGAGPRRGGGEQEPTNVLWLGEVPNTIMESELRRAFAPYGNIVNISRAEQRGMAFVHFEDEPSCTNALRSMRGQPVAGAVFKYGYGKPQGPPRNGGGEAHREGGGDPFANDRPVNVVWLGMIPPSATQADVEALFVGSEGFIDAQYFSDKSIAFAHYDTVEQAVAVRQRLHNNASINGVQVRVGYGKTNHTRGAAAPPPAVDPMANLPMFDSNGVPIMYAPPELNREDNQVTLFTEGGQLTALPDEGGAHGGTTVLPSYATRQREAPQVSVDHRLNALVSSSYFRCNVPQPHLLQPAVVDVIDAVDRTVDEASAERLYTQLNRFSAREYLPHLGALLAKRVKEHWHSDAHKRLLVLYAMARIVHESGQPKLALDSFVLLVGACAAGQDAAAIDHVRAVIASVKRYLDPDVDRELADAFDAVLKKEKTTTDLSNLLKKVQAAVPK